jgi:hypothetical protein
LDNCPKPTANRPATLYPAEEAPVSLNGKQHRAVVVHSSALDKRRQKKTARDLATEKAALEKSFDQQVGKESATQARAVEFCQE